MVGNAQAVLDARDKSIRDYLEANGVTTRRQGEKYFCSSPFAQDSSWSFCIYPTNTYYCFSTGVGGDIIDLVKRLESCSFTEAVKKLTRSEAGILLPKAVKTAEVVSKPFIIERFINRNPKEIAAIKEYASSRSIRYGYEYGVFFTFDEVAKDWKRNPALMFVHKDKDLKITGAKFRKLNNDGSRFSARGRLGFYILDTECDDSFYPKTVYLVESETSANSLWEYFRKVNKPAVVISMGGVSLVPSELPEIYKNLPKRLIIDYDGNEQLYKDRLKLYSHLDAKPIKLILPKGEDINSLFHLNKIDLIEYLLKE